MRVDTSPPPARHNIPRDRFHVVTTHYNPVGWHSRNRLTALFIEHMLDCGVDLTVVETVHGDHPFMFADKPHIRHIPTKTGTVAWGKESAINVGVRALPHTAQRFAWIDADVTFHNRNWVDDTQHQLHFAPVLQPWHQALDLGPDGEVMSVKGSHVAKSFGWVYRNCPENVDDWWSRKAKGEPYAYPHCGYAWAATMSFFDRVGGLLDFSAVGAADHLMSLCFVGKIDKAMDHCPTDAFKQHTKAWGERAHRVTRGTVGFVNGVVSHGFHGDKAQRGYETRGGILKRHNFDPLTDLHRNRYGILELSGNKPALERDVITYMGGRNEDANVLAD